MGGVNISPSLSVPDPTILCPPVSLNADLGGAFQSINSSPNKQVFQNPQLIDFSPHLIL